ncbi:RNA-guided endonuclease InsQ/TnpB family protein [Halosaccharopolyspora lacisalsi]|uniref:RNA-guided endonuclease InsQ/TnpB family protein n=1 Tax=Halosaccharopolyspora lacisalsi TaxID=1000566 RepID=UPI002E28DE25|nr:transposase [Halosaccharopolyspora lacisalsi]
MTALNPTMVVARGPDGRWFVTFSVDTDEPELEPEAGRAAGTDLGVRDFAVTSDGERIANPRHLDRKARDLTRYQRRMAREQRGSNNRHKAKEKVARAHRNVRKDFLHRTSTNLVRYPSPETCSVCGHLLDHLKLATRAWTCPGCRTRPGSQRGQEHPCGSPAGPLKGGEEVKSLLRPPPMTLSATLSPMPVIGASSRAVSVR